MSESLVPILVGGLVGVLATLLTIYLTPSLQHKFWQRQRLAELRFQVVEKLNSMMADFLTNYLAQEGRSDRYVPSRDFFKELHVVNSMVAALFSTQTWDAFKRLEVKISPWLGGAGPDASGRLHVGTVDEFIKARNEALRALYREIGLDLPSAETPGHS